MAQMLVREKHGLSKAAMKDIIHMINVQGFNPRDLRSADVLKSRHVRLLPLVPLYITRIPVMLSFKKKAKKRGFLTDLPEIEVGWRCPIDICLRELDIPGVLDKAIASNHATVRPVANSFTDGRLCREHPGFTFDGIEAKSGYFHLGADIYMRFESHVCVCKLVSIFMYEDGMTSPCRAVYVKLYSKLDDYVQADGDDESLVNMATAHSAGDKELVLDEVEHLVTGASIDFFVREVHVYATEREFQLAAPGSNYLCRYALDQKVSMLAGVSLCLLFVFFFQVLLACLVPPLDYRNSSSPN
jgi:hypothetical protein